SKIRCYEFLKQTSRSFATVIQELDEEVRDAVCLFYLILRGMDTIEDDMTLPIENKEPLLRTFNEIIYKKGWTYTESGPDERDRNLLLEFDVVIEEFLHLKKEYRDIITDIASKTGNGMADYVKNAEHNKCGVITNNDFDLYCYYVAGLVGIGLNGLFSASGLESPDLANETKLPYAMGLFLQKTNILRDYLDDVLNGRKYWPKEIWGKYADDLSLLKEPGYEKEAIECLSEVIMNTLQHVPDCLTYLYRLKNPSVFRFCAIPQVMAMATLAFMFRNIEVYKKIVKIRKGVTVKLILKCNNIYEVASIYRHYGRVIIAKNDPKDPNFLKISMA
ncbi:18310_t:CDS:2, partial [Acaulospora morrowiae]